jgi:chromosome condensin MukBEF complex kleisin-like MukF subunit
MFSRTTHHLASIPYSRFEAERVVLTGASRAGAAQQSTTTLAAFWRAIILKGGLVCAS